jgi:drug/metabolite transporter (DMT)-like permease
MRRFRGGPSLALASAALFGLSGPAAKLLLASLDPWLLAGLLYLGSGIGLTAVLLARGAVGVRSHEASVTKADLPALAGAITAGGVIGPVLLMFGLAHGAASRAALLLNLEGVFTALVAWIVVREHVHTRIALGMFAITAGAFTLAIGSGGTFAIDGAAVLVAGACLAWAVDNNLTRTISTADPLQIAAVKGGVAGLVNVASRLRSAPPGPRCRRSSAPVSSGSSDTAQASCCSWSRFAISGPVERARISRRHHSSGRSRRSSLFVSQ